MRRNRGRGVLLPVIYGALFCFTLALEWIGIGDPGMRVLVNLCTLALTVPAAGICVYLIRRTPQAENESSGAASAPGADAAESGKAGEEERGQEAAADKEGYLAFAHSADLTRRETEIAWLVVNGYSNQRLAQELYISEATVKKHLTHIYEKTGAAGRGALKAAVRDYGGAE